LSQFADKTVELLLQGCGLDNPADFAAVAENVVLVQQLQRDLFAGRVEVGTNDFGNLESNGPFLGIFSIVKKLVF
jgi:hypothetical protein